LTKTFKRNRREVLFILSILMGGWFTLHYFKLLCTQSKLASLAHLQKNTAAISRHSFSYIFPIFSCIFLFSLQKICHSYPRAVFLSENFHPRWANDILSPNSEMTPFYHASWNPNLKPVYRSLSRDQSYRLAYLFWQILSNRRCFLSEFELCAESPEAQFIVPDWGDKVDDVIELSCRSGPPGYIGYPMISSTLSTSQGLWISLLLCLKKICRVGIEPGKLMQQSDAPPIKPSLTTTRTRLTYIELKHPPVAQLPSVYTQTEPETDCFGLFVRWRYNLRQAVFLPSWEAYSLAYPISYLFVLLRFHIGEYFD
jgi:hypothetical protein